MSEAASLDDRRGRGLFAGDCARDKTRELQDALAEIGIQTVVRANVIKVRRAPEAGFFVEWEIAIEDHAFDLKELLTVTDASGWRVSSELRLSTTIYGCKGGCGNPYHDAKRPD